jgi:hypothetical protein
MVSDSKLLLKKSRDLLLEATAVSADSKVAIRRRSQETIAALLHKASAQKPSNKPESK